MFVCRHRASGRDSVGVKQELLGRSKRCLSFKTLENLLLNTKYGKSKQKFFLYSFVVIPD